MSIHVKTLSGSVCISKNYDEEIESLKSEKILWTGAHFPNGTQILKLSERVSAQNKGIVIVFSRYVSNTAKDYGFQMFFVPKFIIGKGEDAPYSGCEFALIRESRQSSKYLYISDTEIKGAQTNTVTPSSDWVMRYVIGV